MLRPRLAPSLPSPPPPPTNTHTHTPLTTHHHMCTARYLKAHPSAPHQQPVHGQTKTSPRKDAVHKCEGYGPSKMIYQQKSRIGPSKLVRHKIVHVVPLHKQAHSTSQDHTRESGITSVFVREHPQCLVISKIIICQHRSHFVSISIKKIPKFGFILCTIFLRKGIFQREKN